MIGTVNTNPSSPTSGNVTPASRCDAGSVTLMAVCLTGQVPQWYNGNAVNSTFLFGGTAYSVNISATTTYYVGCKTTATTCETPAGSRTSVVGTINPNLPAPAIGQTTPGSVCFTGTVTLGASCSTGQTPQWYTNNTTVGAASGTGNSFITPSISVTTTYYVGCKDDKTSCETLPANRQGVVATVNPYPLSPPNAKAGNGAICLGESVSLSATCGTNEVVRWYDSTNGLLTNLTFTPTATGTYNYSVGCKNTVTTCETPQNSRKPVVLVVNGIPTPPTAQNVGGGSVCVNTGASGTVNLTAVCGTNETPQWYNGNISTSTFLIAGTSYSPNISATTTYYVGCKNNSTLCESSATNRTPVIGTVNTNPSSPTSGNVTPASRCDAGSVTLMAVCLTGQVPQWYNGNAVNSTFLFGGTAYSVNISATTTYYVGCKTTATTCETPAGSRTSVVGTVNPNLPAPSSVTPGLACQVKPPAFTSVTLLATCSTGQTPQWFTQAGVFAGTGNSFNVNILATSTFTVGCKDDKSGCETLSANRKSVVATVIINVTNGGEIASNQSNCGPFIPAKLTNVVLPSGGNSTVEYMWLKNLSGSTVYDPNDHLNWINASIVPGEGMSADFQPGSITKTTSFIRCSRSAGCSDFIGKSNIIVITINPFPDAPISPKTNKGAICIGESISLTATCGTNQTVKWYEGITAIGTGESLTYTPTLVGSHTYSVGCQDNGLATKCETIVANRTSVTVMVNPIPATPTNPTISKSAICMGETVSLNATCGTNETAQWYEGNTAIGTGNFTYTPTVLGTHTYTVGCKNNMTNCETAAIDRGKVTLQVNPIPNTPTNPIINKGDICLGESISLSATCGTNETAQWYEGLTAIGTGNFTYTPTVLGSHTYTVGCKNNLTTCETAAANRGKVILKINEIPAAPTVATGGAACGSGSINLTATCATGTTAVWYNTQNATTSLSVGNTFNVTVTANRTYYVACRSLTTPTQCESPASSRKAVEVIFNNNPIPTVTATPAVVCVGGSTKLMVTETFTTYAWKGPNGFSNANQSVDITNIITANAGVYTVTVLASGGCTASATVNVTVNTNPSVTASVTNNTVCQQATIELRSSATAGTGTILSYAWTGPNAYTASIQNPDIATATSAMTGTYIVKVTNSNGCTATSQVSVMVNPLPTATASSEGGNTICLGAPISFVASAAGIGGSYQWTGPAGSGFSETTQSPKIVTTTLANAGVYTLKITNSSGCTAITTINITIDKCLRIGNLVWEDTNNNGIVDGTETGITTPVKVELYKANSDGTLGALVATQNTVNGKYLFSGLEPGSYIVQITAPTGYKSSTGKNGSLTGPFEPAKGVDVVIADNQDRGTTVGTSQVIQSLPINMTNLGEPDVAIDGDDKNGNLTVDFGLYKPGKIGDFVFNDDNRNGQQDATETGVAGVTVNLYDSSSSTIPVATATTDGNGKYLFDNLKPDTYVVEFVKSTLPNDKQFTTQNQGAGATDSDANVGTGKSAPIVLGIGETNLTIDAGIQCPLPTPTATTTTVQVCVGGVIKLFATGGNAYSWKGPNAFSETTADVTISNAMIGNTGIYTVTVTADNKCNATATATVAVTVSQNPSVSATGAVVCTEESINLNVQGTGTFSWKGPNAFSRTEQNPVITGATALNAGIYTVTVMSGSSCNVSTTVNVTVNDRPTAPTETDKNKGFLCDGETLSLSGVCPTGTTIKWYKADGITELNPSQNFNPGSVGVYVYYAVCKNNTTGCETTNNLRVKVTVTVDKIPSSVTPTISKGIICKGETVSLIATCGTNEVPVWYIGTPTTLYTGSLTFTPTTNGTYTYYVSCKSTVGAHCETAVINRKSVLLMVNDNPTASATIKDNKVCTGSAIKFLGGVDGMSSYSWTGPVGFTSSLQNPTIPNAIGANAGNYTLLITNGGSCSATAVVSVTVLVNPIATANGNTICTNETVKLESGATLSGNGNTVASYAWTGPNNFTSSVQKPEIANAQPNRTGTYTVLITDSNGCTATATAGVKVNILPIATASSNSPVCSGNELKLSATPSTGVSYSWSAGNGFVGSTLREPSILNATTANAGTYTVKVTDINGCTAIATTSVTINTLSTATATSNSPICLNNKLTLEVLTNGTSYSWTGPAGSGFTSTLQKPEIASAVAANGGVYTVVVSNGGNCSAIATVNVVINPLPTTTATGAEVCVGKPMMLDATAGFTKYTWTKVGGTFTASTQSPSVTASAVTTDAGVYQVLVTNANGCTALATTTVIVNELPKPTANNNGPVCVGTTITLTANAGFAKYNWVDSKNGFVGSTAVVTIPNALTSNEGIYTVTVTNAKGCVGTSTTEVKVNTNPNPTITPIPAVCLGENIVLNVSGGTNDKYSWTGSNSFTSTQQNPTVSPKPTTAGIYTYFVTIERVGGCTGTATTSVMVKPNPAVTLSSITICAGLTGTITASGADSYAWTGPGTFTTTSANLSVTTAGIYSVTGTKNGCTAIATATVIVNAVPTVTVANITVCVGNDVTFDVKTNATKSFSWTSSTNPKFTSSTQNPTILKATEAATGTYTVTVENTNGCTALATTIVTVNHLPTATASSNSPVCLGSPINLTSTGSGTDFAWIGSNNFTSSVQNPSVMPLPTTAGTYTYLVTVKSGNQCSATATVSSSKCTSNGNGNRNNGLCRKTNSHQCITNIQ